MTDTPAVLSGYRVLDCSIAMAGPFAAQRLGDLGADVIKIEPTAGEWQRFAAAGGAAGNEINVSFLSLNRNKRSVALDLKSADGKAALRDARRDAPTSSCRTTGRASPRASASTTSRCAPINPAIVYVSISGYGEDGPYRDRPGQDLLRAGDVGRDALGTAAPATRRRPPASIWRTPSPRRPRSRACSPRCCTASAPARASS